MDKAELKLRTKAFALRVIKLIRHLPRDVPAKVIANQLMRSATSIGANYRSACRARSRAEFIARLGVVLEESDESRYWLELIVEDGMLSEARVSALLKEADEISAIIYSAISSSRSGFPKC